MNQNHIDRLTRLADKLEGVGPYVAEGPVPDERFDLCSWANDSSERVRLHDCGTTACAVGWACLDEWFQSEGLQSLDFAVEPFFVSDEGCRLSSWRGVAAFFGLSIETATRLFHDSAYHHPDDTASDVAARIRDHIERGSSDE